MKAKNEQSFSIEIIAELNNYTFCPYLKLASTNAC
ncbi:hypothetical protein MTBPR1_260009 [Candidatus Terasakiella magnetica]|uniref:Uncharacterized protein n=1 Tax=Candidatus Terasakiella magnetica TaxID=1867952 RepID=A0A1C3RHD9_9PROT|nr:hypothetical protein MTBPR1_260009 [Candidatus Terasakiella magnetica]